MDDLHKIKLCTIIVAEYLHGKDDTCHIQSFYLPSTQPQKYYHKSVT